MIVIAGSISIPADRRAACLDASRTWQEATRRDEPGCLAYVFAADPVDAGIMSVYELWDSAENLEAHFVHANYWAMRKVFAEYEISGAVVNKYHVDAVAPVYGPDGVATASFGA
jgi:quinol monooxygenase YgiN